MTIYPNLRAEMGRKHISISAMARELGMDRASLSKMLSGDYRLTLDTALSIKKQMLRGKQPGISFRRKGLSRREASERR